MSTIEQILISLISGALGGIISYYYSIKQTKLAHRITLREDKFDEFTRSIIWLKDMMDLVTSEVNFNIENYKENKILDEFKNFDLFNKISEHGSNCTALVLNYGKLYDVNDLTYSEITEVHGHALNIAMRMDYYARHKNETFKGFGEFVEEIQIMNIKWDLLRKKLISIYDSARQAREKDLK